MPERLSDEQVAEWTTEDPDDLIWPYDRAAMLAREVQERRAVEAKLRTILDSEGDAPMSRLNKIVRLLDGDA